MTYHYKRFYCGPVRGVVFDWAGTIVDYGCFAPTEVFIEIFKRFGIHISTAEARAPMGGGKRDHLREILMTDAVKERWQQRHGPPPTEDDVSAMFAEFVPAQIEAVVRHADIIPATLETWAWLREQDIRIGSTTGYSSDIMQALLKPVADQELVPDCLVCADQVPAGRPAPWMCFENARRLDVYPMAAMIKVGDTTPDIAEGLNAGMWTVGVVVTGNEMGLTEAAVKALSPEVYQRQRDAAAARLAQAGAHYIVDSVAELPAVVEEIQTRLEVGDHP